MYAPEVTEAFFAELQKLAFTGRAAATLGAVGGVVGGLSGLAQGAAEDRGLLDSIRSAGEGALVGAGSGAMVGAGVGGVSRLAGHGKMPLMSGPNASGFLHRMGRSVADFGSRQVHALTGYVPTAVRGASPSQVEARVQYLRDIGIGGRDHTRSAIEAAQKYQQHVQNSTSWVPQSLRNLYANHLVKSEQRAFDSRNALMQHGATSLPGVVRALASPQSRGAVARAVKDDMLYGGGAVGTAMMGYGVYDAAKGLSSDKAPEGMEGMTPWQRRGAVLGNAAGFFMPSTVPVAGQVVGGSVLQRALGTVGRGVDKLVGNEQPSPQVVPPSSVGGV